MGRGKTGFKRYPEEMINKQQKIPFFGRLQSSKVNRRKYIWKLEKDPSRREDTSFLEDQKKVHWKLREKSTSANRCKSSETAELNVYGIQKKIFKVA